ncbi:MAG: hypothetical protein HRT44_06745 [Bdellovibrionales bacterium]|nr:hypothetical protein [Bdellovibrionales bacterium]
MKKILSLIFIILVYSPILSAEDERNFRFSTGGPLYRVLVEVFLDFQVSESWTLGPQLGGQYLGISTLSDNSEVQRTGLEIGARANWHSNGYHEMGFYIGPSLVYVDIQSRTRSGLSANVTNSEPGLYAGAVFGYGWFWDTFNMLLGAGFQTALTSASIEYTDSNNVRYKYERPDFGLPVEFSLGWTF